MSSAQSGVELAQKQLYGLAVGRHIQQDGLYEISRHCDSRKLSLTSVASSMTTGHHWL